MRARLLAVSMLAVGTLLSGCQSTVPGDPLSGAQHPVEPTVPITRPPRTVPRALPPLPPSSAVSPPPAAEVLAPRNGYVFIETKSGQTRCQIDAVEVGCEAQFANPPVVDGAPANGVRLTAAGQLRWILGNLGDIPVVTVDYRTYAAQGWTIVATEAGTRFTNDGTSHGMFVSIDRVDAF